MLTASMFKDLPFCDRGTLRSGEPLHHVSAAFGGEIDLGVLSLTLKSSGSINVERDLILHFKALRQTMQDCLHVLRRLETARRLADQHETNAASEQADEADFTADSVLNPAHQKS
jgi:hypothetical protein